MIYKGVLQKMQTEYLNPIQYYLIFEDSFIHMNQILNKEISISFEGYQCLNCNKAKKIFRQGCCYDCFSTSATVGDWIMRPELSTAHLDVEDRDLEYEKKVQLQPHIVYLALTSEVKVGVTRKTQVPTRWIDQGAIKAIQIVEVPNRYLAGITEVTLKEYYSDKTSWQKMLKNDIPDIDLIKEREKVLKFLPEEVKSFFKESEKLYEIYFPFDGILTKIKSLNIEKSLTFSGKLIGIKGQYLIFSCGTVFNVRSNEGYIVNIELK